MPCFMVAQQDLKKKFFKFDELISLGLFCIALLHLLSIGRYQHLFLSAWFLTVFNVFDF